MTWLVPLPVVIPLLGAAVTLLMFRRPRIQQDVGVGTMTATLIVAAALLSLSRTGPLIVAVGGWPVPLGIVLVADRLAALMLVVSSGVTLCVLLYSIGQRAADGDETAPLAVFYPRT